MSGVLARRERRTAHIALRVLIERAFGPEWRRVPYHISPEGKATLPDAAGGFSLSHIPGWALIALAAPGPVGVDLERRRPISLSSARREQLERAAAALVPRQALPADAEERFLQAWVRLESVAKAGGMGLGRLLTSLGVTRSGIAQPPGDALAGLAVHDLDVGPALYAAMALPQSRPAPRVMRLPVHGPEIEVLTRR